MTRSCFRCCGVFHAEDLARVCPACRKPRPDYTERIETRERALYPREKQLAEFVAQGLVNKEIAALMHLTEGTVKFYLHRLFKRLGIENRTKLARYWLKQQGAGA